MPVHFPRPTYNPHASHPVDGEHAPAQSARHAAAASTPAGSSTLPGPISGLAPSVRSQRSSNASLPPRRGLPGQHSQPGVNSYPPQAQGQVRTMPTAPSRSWISRLCCLSDPEHDSVATHQAERPDLSNIQHIGSDLARQRTRQALRPFLATAYNMGQVAENLGQEIGEGVCYGLCMEWLANRRAGSAAQHRDSLAALRSPAAMNRAQHAQDDYAGYQQSLHAVSHDPTVRTDMAVKEMLSRQGLQASRATRQFDGESMSPLTRAPGDYVVGLIGFGAGHAITIHRPARNERDQRLTVFDSNMGEFKISARDEGYFFDAMRAHYDIVGARFTHASAYLIQ